MAVFEGQLVASGLRFGIVVARWNDFMGNNLLEGAKDALHRHGVAQEHLDVVYVPGSFEISLAAEKMAASKKYHAVICLGVLIRGTTAHFDLIAATVTNAITQINLKHGIPVTFGVITTDTIEQAIERSGCKAGNKGSEAALAAIEMANLIKVLA